MNPNTTPAKAIALVARRNAAANALEAAQARVTALQAKVAALGDQAFKALPDDCFIGSSHHGPWSVKQ